MSFPRASGVLMHISSLPGSPGIGDFGSASRTFVDWLHKAGQLYWQTLPFGPTGYGDSPYAATSAFAGNPLFISPEQLISDGLLPETGFEPFTGGSPDSVDYQKVNAWKSNILEDAFSTFQESGTVAQKDAFAQFCKEEAAWLDDYSLFITLKEAHDLKPWWEWAEQYKLRSATALKSFKKKQAQRIQFHQFVQWVFYKQWFSVKTYANEKGIQIIGDLPIFVARDSCDAWASPELFYFDKDANPVVVAGVPPDYFSPTGQLWGNPIYRWELMAVQGYQWWIDRFKALFKLVDVVRIDHFRGFDAYWAVPYGEETAVNGSWQPAPGMALFDAVTKALGNVPIIAEDLGFITQSVLDLRDKFDFPGMKILQFSFATDEKGKHIYLPHLFESNSVSYSGTHDNDTSLGWFKYGATPEERATALEYMHSDGSRFAWDLVKLTWRTYSDTALAPMQDLLELDTEHRMNMPGSTYGNWAWRCLSQQLSDDLAERLHELTEKTYRLRK